MIKKIKVIDRYGFRHHFQAECHYYKWRLKKGTFDIEDNQFLDVFRRRKDDDDQYETVTTFPNPACVGIVTDTTALTPLMRERQLERCPRCGFVSMP